MYLRFDRSERDVEFGGYLLVGVLLEETQFYQPPVTRRHVREVILELFAVLVVDDALFGRSLVRRGIDVSRPACRGGVYLQVVAPFAHEVDEGVPRDGIYPLAESEGRIVFAEVEEDLDESLLQQVVGIVAVASRPVEVEFVDAVPIAVEKRLESYGIPVVGKGDELLVGEYDVVAYLHSPGERLNLRSAAIHASYSGEQRS